MSIIYRIDREKGITLSIWDGAVTEDEVLDHLRRLVADPDWPTIKRLHLTDLRTTTAYLNIDETIIKKMVALLGKSPGKLAKLKMAMVANEAFAISTTFQRLMSIYPLSMIAFNSLDTACTWLGMNTADTERALEQLRARARAGTGQQGKD